MFFNAFLTKLGSLVYRSIPQCGWVDPTSPPQPPAGPPDQWCVNSDQGAMPGVWASWFLFFHIIKLHICSKHHQFSNKSDTESPNINISRLVLQSSLSDPLKPGVKFRMQMWLEQRRQAMLQLHSSDQKFHCQLVYKVDRSNQDTIHYKNAVHRSSFVLVSYESVSHVVKNPVFLDWGCYTTSWVL